MRRIRPCHVVASIGACVSSELETGSSPKMEHISPPWTLDRLFDVFLPLLSVLMMDNLLRNSANWYSPCSGAVDRFYLSELMEGTARKLPWCPLELGEVAEDAEARDNN